MIIRAIDLENIRSHKSSHIEFKNGITVITGDVGSGKTTIMEAIKFALFGGTSENYRNLLRMNENQGSVSLFLEDVNDSIKITRMLRKTKDGYSGSNVILSINGKEKEMSDREMKKFISSKFKIYQYRKRDPLFFKTLIYASQEEMKSIISMDPEERREMILDLFQITSYNKIIENCDILRDYAKTKIDISKGIIGENGSRIIDAKSEIEDIRIKINRSNEKIKNLDEEYKTTENEIKNIESLIIEMEDLKNKREKIENSIGLEKERYNAIEEELKKKNKKIEELENKKKILENLTKYEISYNEKEKEYNDLQNKQYEFNILRRSLDKANADLKNLQSKKKEIDENRMEINELEMKIKDLINEKKDIDEKAIDNLKNERSSLTWEINREKESISDLKNEINDLKNLEKMSICPKCKRPLDREHTEILIKEDLNKIEEKNAKIMGLNENLNKIDLKIKGMEEIAQKNKSIENEILRLSAKKSTLEKMVYPENEILEKIHQMQMEIENLELKIQNLNFEEEKFNKISAELRKLKKFHEDYLKIENEIKIEDELKNEVFDYNKKLSDINKKVIEYEKMLSTINFDDEKYRSIKDEYEEKRLKLNTISVNIESLKRETTEKEDEIKRKEQELESLLFEEKRIKNFSMFINWLDGTFIPEINAIISGMINALRIEFESELSEWFQIMLPGTEFDVGIDNNFSPIIRYDGYEFDLSALSGGESNALAFSYRLAMNSMVKKFKLMDTNFILLDEPTDGFSEKQIMRMGEVFSNLNVDQILIVTHENALENFADNRIKIFKEDGISKI